MIHLKLKLVEIYLDLIGGIICFLCFFIFGFLLWPGHSLIRFLIRRWLIKKIKKYSGDEKENEDILRDLWYVFYKSDPSGELLYQLSLVPSYLPWVEGIRERISDDISAAWRY